MSPTRRKLRYVISLQIRHPNIDPKVITDRLGWVPFRAWRKDELRRTLDGARLGGRYPSSAWVHRFEFRDANKFFRDCSGIVTQLERHRDFLLELHEGGGVSQVVVQLPGAENIGDILECQTMAMLASLRVRLGLEVFPHMRN